MLDVMKMSMIGAEYQYKIFINKKIIPNINYDYKDLVAYFTHSKDGFWITFFSGFGVLLSIACFIGYSYFIYSEKLGWGNILLGTIALIMGIGLSGTNSKFIHLFIFFIIYILCSYYDRSTYPVILLITVWIITWFNFYMSLRLIFNKLRANRNLFMVCVKKRWIAIYFDDNNQKEAEKFMKQEGINQIPVDENIGNYLLS